MYGIRRRFVFLQIKEYEFWYLPEELRYPYKYALIRVKIGMWKYTNIWDR